MMAWSALVYHRSLQPFQPPCFRRRTAWMRLPFGLFQSRARFRGTHVPHAIPLRSGYKRAVVWTRVGCIQVSSQVAVEPMSATTAKLTTSIRASKHHILMCLRTCSPTVCQSFAFVLQTQCFRAMQKGGNKRKRNVSCLPNCDLQMVEMKLNAVG